MKLLIVVGVISATLMMPSAAQAAPTKPPAAQAAGFWHIMKCGVAIGTFVAGNGLLITKLRKAGGVYKVAKKVWRVKGAHRKWEALVGVFGYVSGVGAVVEGCT